MRAGVLGGTFDPPHLGHVRLAEAARAQLRLDRVIFLPAGDPYRKAARRVSPAAVRLALARAAVADLPWAEVSTIEVDRRGPSYTDETLEGLARDAGDWWFIAGADVLLDLPHWHDPQRLVAAARLAVAERPPAGRVVPAEAARAVPGIAARIDWLELTPLDISSTELRRRIALGESVDGWLAPAVRELVERLGLYRAERTDDGA